ncbi:acyltransferase family protein [Echinicola pacifica]|uniref:acyltransferase family protein n=1 Tax=Echinicola pacifica TaxID=346377 RepID=UPI000370EDAC|nr:heparan-alpha-glucosaminide N-acetyltransferase domain-containing protein [Echinicola pacifica]
MPSQRILSLDVFRGITIFAMILVNNPGSWSSVYPPLLHAPWHGCTPTDMIFPFFLFIVGVAIELSIGSQLNKGYDKKIMVKKAGIRALKLIGLGLLLTAFPYFDFANLRYPGVLQRIGLVYFVSSLMYLYLSPRGLLLSGLLVLLGYWAAMTLIPVPGIGPANLLPDTNLAAWIDRQFLTGHMWSQSKTWDPEGLFSTLPAIVTCLLGIACGKVLTQTKEHGKRMKKWLIYGGSLLLLGLLWSLLFPMNKALWTSSFVLYTAGWAFMILALSYWLVDIKGWKNWSTPFVIYGMNAITVFFLSGIIAKMLSWIKVNSAGELISLKLFLQQMLFNGWLSPKNASLAGALFMVMLLFIPAYILWRKNIIIKV